MYKIFKHRKHPCIRCLGKRIFICNNKIFFVCFFTFVPFATQLFSTPVTSSNLRNLRSSAFYRAPINCQHYMKQQLNMGTWLYQQRSHEMKV